MTKKLVSVIIPVYKVEEYLESCVNSVINQSYRNIEIILVDDGSPDKCGYMCDMFSKKDNRIRVIHKNNGGLSDARNAGLDICIGNYIVFVDSDDLVDVNYIERLLNLVESGADIAVCVPKLFHNEQDLYKKTETPVNISVLSSKQALRELLIQNNYYFEPSAWGKIYKAELFEHLRFPFGKYFEDLATTYLAVDMAKNVVCTTEKLYFYRQRNGSILNSAFNKKMLDILEIADEMYQYIIKNHPDLEVEAKARVISAYSHILIRLPRDSRWDSLKYKIYFKIKDFRKGQLMKRDIRIENKAVVLLSYLGSKGFFFMMNALKVINK